MKKLLILTLCVLTLSSCSIVLNNSSLISDNLNSSISEESIESIDESSSSIEESSSEVENNQDELVLMLEEPSFETPRRLLKEEVIFDDLFNLGNRVDVSVKISEEELNKLAEDENTGYKVETYRLADEVTISLKNYENVFTWTFDNVGIRQKGNTSRQDIFDGNGNLNLNHFKLSFDETFTDTSMYSQEFINQYGDELRKDREFLGLSGLDFKWNKNYDETHIKEVYSSYLYQAGGLISQHIGLSTFSLVRKDRNNKVESMGLCTLFEPASKSLIKRSLKNENKSYLNMRTWAEEKAGSFGVPNENYGDYYEASYGIGEGNYHNGADLTLDSISGKKIGIKNTSGSYIPVYERKTNTDVEYDDVQFRNIVAKLNSAKYEELEEYIDMEYLAKEQALSFILGNADAMRYNYNNYSFYIRRTDGKMIIVPIDNDRCFGITRDWNIRDALKNDGLFSKDTSTGTQRNPLLLKTILADQTNSCRELYFEISKILKASPWVLNETFNTFFNKAKTTYSEFSFSLNDSNISFSDYISSKIRQIPSNISSGDNPNDDVIGSKDMYICGTFNSWGQYSENELSLYKFEDLGDGVFQVDVVITQGVDNGKIKFKINAGYNNWNELDWTFSSDLTTLITEVGDSASLYGVNVGDTVRFKINIVTKEAEVIIL